MVQGLSSALQVPLNFLIMEIVEPLRYAISKLPKAVTANPAFGGKTPIAVRP